MPSYFTHFTVFSVLIAFLIYKFQSQLLYFWPPFQSSKHASVSESITSNMFTVESLKQYNGVDKPQLYLALLGKVFDVTKGSQHYGAGKSYNFFIGKDGSRSFITGEFGPNEADDDVIGLKSEDFKALDQWVRFYHKEYKRVGKLIGRYYQENGKLTNYGKEIKKLLKAAILEDEAKKREDQKYPPCNVEWSAEEGSRVWCTTKSGGIDRDWVGVPRQMYEAGSKTFKCVCLNTNQEYNGQFKEYENCDNTSDSCFVKEEK